MRVLAFRNILGDRIPNISRAVSAAVTADNPVVVEAGDTTVAACADHAVLALGWAITFTDTVGEKIDIVPAYPGIQAKMLYVGDHDPVNIDDYVGIDNAANVQSVDIANLTQKLFKLAEVGTEPDGTKYAWVEIASTLSQALAEVS